MEIFIYMQKKACEFHVQSLINLQIHIFIEIMLTFAIEEYATSLERVKYLEISIRNI